ncbi:MAG: TlpA disulfide reductase family protein [Gammaproteobacteria bacterium]
MRLTLTIAAVLSISWLAAAPGVSAARSLAPVPGRPPAPPLALRDLDGHLHRLQDYRGQVVVINFWATWCPPCRREMPSMERAWKRLRGHGVALLAVSVDQNRSDVLSFLARQPVSFTILLDPGSGTTRQWPVRVVPTTVVVDPRGRLAYRAVGALDWDDPALLARILALRAPRLHTISAHP